MMADVLAGTPVVPCGFHVAGVPQALDYFARGGQSWIPGAANVFAPVHVGTVEAALRIRPTTVRRRYESILRSCAGGAR